MFPGYVLLIIKILFLIGLLIYMVFAGVLVRQEQLMADVLEESFEPFLRMLVVGHLLLAIAVFGVSVFVL